MTPQDVDAVASPSLTAHFDFLEKITNDARDGLIVTDDTGRIVLFSHAAGALFGYDADEVVGRDMTMLMQEPHRSQHARYMADYRTSGKGRILGVGPRELPARHKNGSMVPIELSVSEVLWNGRRVFVGICRDISERVQRDRELRETRDRLFTHIGQLEETNRKLESQQREAFILAESLARARDEALEADRTKSEFLATMSHEMRTPLNGVIGMAQVLANTELSAGQREHLDVVTECSTRLLALVNELLDMAKIEAGLMTIEARKANLSDFIQLLGNHWRQRTEAKGLIFKLTVAREVPPVAELDEVRLRQVLDNLLGNALKFTETGEISVEVGASPGAAPGEATLRFDVRDTGPGIAAESHERIFQPFVQSDSSITRRFGGTGLGLAICKKLTVLMGGVIGVESTPGKGSRFWVTCPCRAEAFMARSSQTITELPGRRLAEHPPLNVLVAEDNEINRKVIETMLTLLGHRSRMANDGREALVLLDCAQFDVILMDLYMPEMDGAAAARAIRQRPDRCAQMPIVGLTASTLERDRNACLAAGMTAVITKPVEIATLTAALAPYTRRSSAPPILPAAPPDRSGAPCMSAVKAV